MNWRHRHIARDGISDVSMVVGCLILTALMALLGVLALIMLLIR
jgi:hypothetical protein